MNEANYLPPIANDIIEVIGFDGFMRLVNAYGGVVIRVPGRGDLKQVLTAEQYKKFVHVFRNEKLSIPKLQARLQQIEEAETLRLLEQGYTKAQAARALKVTERTIYLRQAKHKQKQNDKQQDLF